MKTTVQEQSPTKRSIDVEIPEEDVRREIDQVAKQYAREIKVPGFRKGRTPPAVARQRFQKEIEGEALERLAKDSIWKAIDENKLRPLHQPEVEEFRYEAGSPLTFKAKFEIRPEIELGTYKGLEVDRAEPPVTDELVEKNLESVRERHVRFDAVEGRALAAGDIAVVDTRQLDADGNTEGEPRTGVFLDLGDDGIVAEQREQVLGMEVGETREITVPDAPAAEPAEGEEPAPPLPPVRHEVTLRAIRNKVLPDLDDEFAKEVGEFESLDALRERIRSDLAAQAAEQGERDVREKLLTQLVEAHDFPPPELLVRLEQDRMLEHLAAAMAGQGVDPSKIGFDWEKKREELQGSAERRVRADLLLEEIARAESLEVPDSEILGALKEEARRAKTTPAALKARLEQEGRLELLKIKMLREKSLDLMVESANIMRNVPSP